MRWTTHHNQPLPAGATERDGILTFDSVTEAHDGGYICNVYDPVTRRPNSSPIARLLINRRKKNYLNIVYKLIF